MLNEALQILFYAKERQRMRSREGEREKEREKERERERERERVHFASAKRPYILAIFWSTGQEGRK